MSLSLSSAPPAAPVRSPRVDAPRPQYIELKANVHRKLLNRLNLEALANADRSRAAVAVQALNSLRGLLETEHRIKESQEYEERIAVLEERLAEVERQAGAA